MGNAILTRKTPEVQFPSLLQETQIFALWTIDDVKELLKRFQSQIHGFALVEAQFETIVAFKPSVAEHVDLEQLFEILDNDHDGRMDGLELLGGLALCCHASFEEKARFCFELYDFNLNSLLSRKELAMMMMSCVCGLNLLTGGTEELEPDISAFESFADDAISRADLNADGQISYEEFVFWVRSNRELMNGLDALHRIALEAKLDVQSDDSAPETDDNNSVFDEEEAVSQTVLEFVDDNFLNRKLPKLINVPVADQALSVVPWLGQVFEPTNYKKAKNEDTGPDTNLELSWAFGNRCKLSVNNVRYLASSHFNERLIVYSIGAVCIVLRTKSRQQSFYLGHSCEVTCLAVHPNQQMVATGDIQSNIHVWTLDKSGNAVSVQIIHAMVKQGIQQVAFSPKGDKVACVGLDVDQTLCLYNSSNGELVSSAKGMTNPNAVRDIAFSTNGTEIAMVGKNQVKFFVNVHTNNRHMESKLGKIGSQGKRQVFCCVTYLDQDAFVGCASGEIYRFRDTQCIAMIQAHGVKEPVLCLFANPSAGNLLSGGKDSFVKTWDATLKEIGIPIDLSEDVDGDGRADSGSLNSAIISIQQVNETILVSTLGCDIFEVTLPLKPADMHSMQQLAWGHSEGELWGLAVHPSKDEFVTVGDDKSLRVWSLRSHDQINVRLMPGPARAVEYNHSGAIVCIGQMDGTISLMEVYNPALRVYSTWKHCNKMINDVKFSPDDTVLAVASSDTNIYLYKSEDRKNFRRLAVCRGHSGAVMHLDFSVNNLYIQSNGNDSSLLYWDTTGNQVRQGSQMKDVVWDTYSCIYNWGVKGMWPPGADYSDINTCMALPQIGDLVCGDDFGKVHLYRYPALRSGAIHQTYIGHASHVTSVKFSWNKRYLISLSGGDRAILVWKHKVELEESDHEMDGISSSSASASSGTEAARSILIRKDHPEVGLRSVEQEAAMLGMSVEEMKEQFTKRKQKSNVSKSKALSMITSAVDAAPLAPPRGDESTAVAPWRSSIIEPSRWVDVMGTTDVDFELQWVHGHRSHDCRNNIFYSADGSVVYNAANMAVVFHKPSGKQNFLLGSHADEVISIDIHPAGQLFATGEAGRLSSVVVWDSKDMSVSAKLTDIHVQGVGVIAFNSAGNILASVGLDDDNTLCIHDWSKNFLLLSTPTNKDRVLCACFLLVDDRQSAGSQENQLSASRDILVTGGTKYLKFWWWQGQNVQSQTAIWGRDKKERKSTILCVASTNRDVCVTGSAQGNLLIWKNFKLVCNVRQSLERWEGTQGTDLPQGIPGGYLHQSSILAMWGIAGSIDVVEDWNDCKRGYELSSRYITGDRDGRLCIWRLVSGHDNNLYLILMKTFVLPQSEANLKTRSIKSICERDGLILIGDDAGEMYEVREEPLSFVKDIIGVASTKLALETESSSKQPVPQLEFNESLAITTLATGHRSGDVWGLVTHPFLPVYFTGGDDGSVKCWGLNPHRLISFVALEDKARAIDILPSTAAELVVGLNNGKIMVFDTKLFVNDKTGMKASLVQNTSEKEIVNANPRLLKNGPSQGMQTIKYCFNGTLLAAASLDGKVYVYGVQQSYDLLYVFGGHACGGVTHLDFGVALRGETVVKAKESAVNDKGVEVISEVIAAEIVDPELQQILTVQVSRETVDGKCTSKLIDKSLTTRAITIDDIIVQSTSVGGELLFWNADDGSRITSMSVVKDAWWATLSCPFGWSVQGIWPVEPNSSLQSLNDIVAVTRSHTYSQVPVVATADMFGRVRLYNYPCVQPGAPEKCYRGHSARVSNIAFSFDDNYCITVGGQDRCVFVWATDVQDEMRERSVLSIQNRNVNSYVNQLLVAEEFRNGLAENVAENDVSAEFEISKIYPTPGDQRGAVLPWKGAIREPTDWKEPRDASAAPTESLNLTFVHGYRGWDCRNNLFFADHREVLVYHVAALGIAYNTQTQTQIINSEHDDDILCLCLHPEGYTVATGEIGKFPKIVLWDANTGVTLRIINGHKRGVSHVAFADQGKTLISCGLDDDRTVLVHDSQTGQLIGKGNAGKGVEIYALSVSANGQSFVTAGKNTIKFWDVPVGPKTSGLELSCKSGIYNIKSVKARTICSAAYLGDDAITGMNDGTLLMWKNRSNTKCIPAHTGAVTAMTTILSSGNNSNGNSNAKFRSMDGLETGPRILTGGKDGNIHMWDVQFNKLWSLNLAVSTPTSAGPQIQSLSVREQRVLIGTKAAEIYECNLLGSTDLVRHVAGHYNERAEVWGLDVHPTLTQFVTAGDDMTVRVWDSKLLRLKNCVSVDAKCRAVAYHPDGSQIAVALYDGKLQVFSDDLQRVGAKVMVSSSWSQCLRYSPDGLMLAIGGHDDIIYLLETKSYACLAKCKGHHSFITGMDFSSDGRILQSVSGDYELLFWDSATGKQITNPSAVRDVKWHSLSCTLGWSVQGIWPPNADGTDVNSVDRSPNGRLLASGDDFHLVKLFRYPCFKERAAFKSYKGHAEHVLKVKFSADGKYLFSVGGLDKAILQFEVKG